MFFFFFWGGGGGGFRLSRVLFFLAGRGGGGLGLGFTSGLGFRVLSFFGFQGFRIWGLGSGFGVWGSGFGRGGGGVAGLRVFVEF